MTNDEERELLAAAIKKLYDDLQWRGPNGRQMAHVVLERRHAEVLHKLLVTAMNVIDAGAIFKSMQRLKMRLLELADRLENEDMTIAQIIEELDKPCL